MWKKIAIVGGVAAAIVGSGTAALAVSGSTGSATTPAASSSHGSTRGAHGSHHGGARAGLGHVLHGQWVTQNPTTGALVTHDEITGVVTAVSGGSLSVKAADGVGQTYTVTSSTKVLSRGAGTGKPTSSTIGQVHDGDAVAVTGTGTGSYTATRIVDRGAGSAQ